MEILLETLKSFLPICKDECDLALAEHNQQFPSEQHTVDSLKRKFTSFHRKTIVTGDLRMPSDVHKAKNICYMITKRACIGEVEDVDVIASDEMQSSLYDDNDDEADKVDVHGTHTMFLSSLDQAQ